MSVKIKRILPLLVAIAIVSMGVVGCGKKSNSTANYESKPEMAISEDQSGLGNDSSAIGDVKNDAMKENTSTETTIDPLNGQGKIIRNGSIQMETLSFDETVKQILSRTSSIGAYVQSSNVSGKSIESKSSEENRRGEFILRIPKVKFDSFILDIGNLGSVTDQQISTEDITSVYFDTQAHLKSLTIQEERLIELLKKTGELKDIITLENELSRVRYEIENLTGSLKKWDNLIDFCTLNIQISEVHSIKENPVSLGDKIANGFVNSVNSLIDFGKGFIVIISICIPYLVILSIALLIIRFIFKHRKIN
ncbi:DUF4349 domain-containing protein [Clostridium sp.]|uniref:DUF4349 domain-containing protein n=1 Tax=Clostridium sp. TaxID=1506 RepID=UPI001A493D4E|nr:DUF4349 domain-containing protein [Clostridium sp.]MBK5242701.1 DUF4349 domain-containing protein [Clostridium sp.]